MPSRTLPLFPIGMVLFPGATVPLHLFEPRYRRMLVDVQAGDKCFGILCALPGVEERDLPAGRVGCVAEVVQSETLDDGRANIVVSGRSRFALDRFLDQDAPYHVAEVTEFDDQAEGISPVALAVSGDEVLGHFKRVVRAVQTLNDEPAHLPDLPDDGAELAFAIASMIDFDLQDRQAVLTERSPLVRLQRVDSVLRTVLPDLELRAALHEAQGE